MPGGTSSLSGPSPRAAMGPTARSAALLLLLVAILFPLRAESQAGERARHSPLAGSRVYGGAGCAGCHSVRGHGGDVGPDLARIDGERTLFQLGAALWNHLPALREHPGEGRTARSRLGPNETGRLVAFLSALGYFDPEGDPEEGRRYFQEKNCAECHQVGGVGGVVGPNLDYLRYLASPIQVAAAMWNHGPEMTRALEERQISRPQLPDSAFVDLVAFLRSASPGIAGSPLHVLPGDAAEGSRLYRSKRCVRCHGLPGQGGQVGPDLARQEADSPLLFAAAMWNHQPEMGREARRRGISMPRLEPAQMADLVAYLESVRRRTGGEALAEGREVVLRRGCLDCHTLAGRGAGTAPGLGDHRGLDSPAAVIGALWTHALVADSLDVPLSDWPHLEPEDVAGLSAFLSSTTDRDRRD